MRNAKNPKIPNTLSMGGLKMVYIPLYRNLSDISEISQHLQFSYTHPFDFETLIFQFDLGVI